MRQPLTLVSIPSKLSKSSPIISISGSSGNFAFEYSIATLFISIGNRSSLVPYTAFSKLDISIVNVMIDKRKIKRYDYKVLENALTYNIQRIENDSNSKWNYIIITVLNDDTTIII